MITLRNELVIQRPVAEVFDFVVNVENVPKWQPAVTSSTRVTPGPLRVGSQFREVARMLGREVTTLCEIKEITDRLRFAFAATSSGPFEYESTYSFEDFGGTTKLTILGTFRLKGLWRFLEFLAGPEMRKESAQELRAMKAAIESRV